MIAQTCRLLDGLSPWSGSTPLAQGQWSVLRDGRLDVGAGLSDRTAARHSGLRRLGPFSAAGVEQPANLGDVHVRQIPHVRHELIGDDRERFADARALKGHCQLEQSKGDFRRFASVIHQVACDL